MVETVQDLDIHVNLYVSARNIDAQKKSNLQCIVREYEEQKNGDLLAHDIRMTEKSTNNLNPDWKSNIEVAYFFEKKQILNFQIVGENDEGDSEVIGELEATLGQIMGARTQTFKRKLVSASKETS